MKLLGIFLIGFGLVDLFGNMAVGFDLWGEFLHIQLPDIIWQYSAYIEMAIGYVLMTMGDEDSSDHAEHEA